MHTNPDIDRDPIDRRAAVTLIASATVALKANLPSAAQAQAAPALSFPQILNGSGARFFPTNITSELQQLAPNVFAYVQQEPPGWSSFNLSNCGVVAGVDSLLAIDATAAPTMAKKFVAASQQATGKRFKRVVLTHFHPDHTGGTQFIEAAEVIAHEQCRAMMAQLVGQPKPAYWATREGWADGIEEFKLTLPNETYSDKLTIYDYDDAPVEFIYPGPAHTTGDRLVYLPKQKILFVGDCGQFGGTPSSSYVVALIKTCDKILAMDVETIVPGHGRVGGKAELADMRDYYLLIQREGKKRFDAGMTPGRAAAEIDVGKYKTWADPDKIAINMLSLYSEFNGTTTADQDLNEMIKARQEYTAIKNGR